MNDLHILTECYIDTLLANVISPPKKRYNHQHNCTKVLGVMKDRFKDKAAFGIIDDDGCVPALFKSFELLKRHNENLAIYKHNEKPHYIVKVGKAAEDFILKNAEKCGVSMINYNLPDNLSDLKKRTKSITVKNDPDLKRLFKAIKQNTNSDFYTLAQWIEKFKTNLYDLETHL
ncbi:MAG: hypothetical protein LBR81_08020 [Prevotellaceae bacterium]|jgi:hypothetical protein|nr:hypothetical protein [Prevotellaceae bacterium]